MKIIHKTRGARGRLHGVDFTDGIGFTDDPDVAERLRLAGHTVEYETLADPRPVDVDDRVFADPSLEPVDDSTFADPSDETDPWAVPQA